MERFIRAIFSFYSAFAGRTYGFIRLRFHELRKTKTLSLIKRSCSFVGVIFSFYSAFAGRAVSAGYVLLAGVALSACGTQPPAPIVDGYGQQRTYTYSAPTGGAQAVDFQQEALRFSSEEERYYVHGGDKLDQIAKHFGVNARAILERNNLISEADLPVGEYIVIPSPAWQASRSSAGATYRLTDKYEPTPSENIAEPTAPSVAENKPAQHIDVMRQHTLQEGENIYRLSLKYNVSQFDILAANNIRNPEELKPGMVLNIPQAGDKVNGSDDYRYLAGSNNVQQPKPMSITPQQVQPKKMTPNNKAQGETSAPVMAAQIETNYYNNLAKQYTPKRSYGKGMIWPAEGKVTSKFGTQGRGINHSGIKIALKQNAPIYAAENGTVIYSDNGLEQYGNLILIRHNGGYVTAYAHNAKNLVKRNQKVAKGDLIGFAGTTGNVATPQLHFEVRKNAQPIDPLKVLPR